MAKVEDLEARVADLEKRLAAYEGALGKITLRAGEAMILTQNQVAYLTELLVLYLDQSTKFNASEFTDFLEP